ncbi:MAG: energy transducer TonB [Ferruginibacter sp.]
MIKIKNYKQCSFWVLLFSLISLSSSAQNPVITKYFDSSWKKISKDSAFYFTEMVKEDTFYRCTSYWMRSKKLNCKSAYSDTLFSKPIGLLLRFYENGQTEDSTYFYDNGALENTYHYYPTGKLWVHFSYNLKTKRDITEAYDLNGNRIDDFIYLKDASYQEGGSEWQTYLAENVKTKVPVKNGAPLGEYQVIIKFIVGQNGKITDVEAETNKGYGMEEEVIRVIKKSPKWNPAILLGKTVNAYRRQPLTFIVAKE